MPDIKIKLDPSKLKRKIRKIPEVLAANTRLFLAGTLLLDALIVGFVFYKYSFLAVTKEITPQEAGLILRRDQLTEISGQLKERKQKFKTAASKDYPDLFRTQEMIELETQLPAEPEPESFEPGS